MLTCKELVQHASPNVLFDEYMFIHDEKFARAIQNRCLEELACAHIDAFENYGLVFWMLCPLEGSKVSLAKRLHFYRQMMRTKSSDVYFAFADGYVKIGVSSSVQCRLKTIAMQSGRPIENAYVIRNGGESLEAELHDAFGEHRTCGEWFRDCEAIRTYAQNNGIGV